MNHRIIRTLTLGLFGRKRRLPKRWRRWLAHHLFLLADWSYARRSVHRSSLPHGGLPQVQGSWPARAGSSPILFAVADPSYFQRYAALLAKSVSDNSPRTALHLHIIGGTAQTSILADGLRKRFPSLDCSYTWEPASFAAWHWKEVSRFCQCVRFVRALDLLVAAERPVLAIDIDGFVLREISSANAVPDGTDVGLALRPEASDPADLLLAGAVYLAPTAGARRFMTAAAQRMLRHLSGPVFTPKLDQRCLALTYKALAAEIRIAQLPREFVSTNPQDAIIFTAKGPLKRERIFELWEILSRTRQQAGQTVAESDRADDPRAGGDRAS